MWPALFLQPAASTASVAKLLTLATAVHCRGPALLRAPPPVVEALLSGMPAGAAAASQLDALQVGMGCGW